MSSSAASSPRIAYFLYHWLFDHEHVRGLAKTFERWIAALIILSVFSIVFEHVPEIENLYASSFHGFDWITVIVFTLEYVLRVWTAPQSKEWGAYRFPRLRYVFSFYALVDLVAIAPFYFAQFVALDVEMLRVLRLLRLMRMFKLSRQLLPAIKEFRMLNQGKTFRQKVYALMEPTGHSGRLHYLVDNFIVAWIAVSIVCVVLESVDSIKHLFAVQFQWVDVIAFSIFTFEYIARVYSAPEKPAFAGLRWKRWAHLRTGQALIDLVTIAPFVFEHFLPYALDLRFLRVFRLMRMLKFTRYTTATQTLIKVFKREWPVIAAAVFVMSLLIVLMASLGYLTEHDAQPDKFENIPVAIYWAVITLASVGYGDLSPITPLGRSLTVLTSLAGIGIFAVPAGLLASAFTDQLKQDREDFRQRLIAAYADGEMNSQEHELIMAELERLHLSKDQFQKLVKQAKQEFKEKTAQSIQYGHLMLDVEKHPEVTVEQFGILVAQIKLLQQVVGADAMKQSLHAHATSNALALKVCDALARQAPVKI